MKLIAEISMYPLRDEYIRPIDAFIAELNGNAELEVTTNRMSTQVFGDYEPVMHAVAEAMRNAHELHGAACFACKFIPGAERTINGYQ